MYNLTSTIFVERIEYYAHEPQKNNYKKNKRKKTLTSCMGLNEMLEWMNHDRWLDFQLRLRASTLII